MSVLHPDRIAVERFLSTLFVHADDDTFISLRAFDDEKDGTPALFIEGVQVGSPILIDRVCSGIARAAQSPRPAVFCPPVATFLGANGAKAADLANGVALSVECDAKPKDALARLSSLLGPPTLVAASGGVWTDPATGKMQEKLHVHYRLSEPTRTAADHARLREARELACNVAGGDPTTIAIVHPMRWPGSWHRKRTPRLSQIVSISETELDLDDALDRLRQSAPEKAKTSDRARSKGAGPFGFAHDFTADLLDITAALAVIPNHDLDWAEWNRIGMATWMASAGRGLAAFDAWSQKSSKYDPTATNARWRHYDTSPPDSIGAGTLFFLASEADPRWSRPSRAESDGTRARQEPGEDAAGGGEKVAKPTVRVVAGELPRVVDEAEAALLASGISVFSRAGALVRPILDTVPAAHGRLTTVAKFKELVPDTAVDLLSRVAEFQRYDGRVKDWVTIDPPAKVATTLLAREGEWKVPPVVGIITTPTLRPDGTILSAPGYDPATRLFHAVDASLTLPPIPEKPSRADAERALRLLGDLLSGFPFVGPVDRAVALSGIITAVTRGAMSVAPLHAIRAHSPGTGKSFLVDVAATIATGRLCPVIAAGKTEEETEKRLGSLLREAVPIVSLDNVNGELGGDALCQMTERPLVRIRILGRSETPEFEVKATVFATGNNLTLVGDMTRRTILCSLDARVERPELRSFAFNPVARVLADRGTYVAAALTIAMAYRAAGSPSTCKPVGSYGQWSDTVRAPLIWLGEADPVDSMETARDEDPELAAIRELFGFWEHHLAEVIPYTTNAIIQAACEKAVQERFDYNSKPSEFRDPEFRDLLLRVAGDGGAVSSRRLGKWLARISGKIVDGRSVTMRIDGSHGNKFSLSRRETQTEPANAPLF